MPSPKRTGPNWAACKTVLKNWPHEGIVGLVHELYKLSDENRQFFHARLLTEQSQQTLDAAKKELSKLMSWTTITQNRFSHSDVKRVIDRYAKATDDPAAVAELLVEDLSISFSAMFGLGDFEEMVDHIYSTLNRLNKTLEKICDALPAPLIAQINELATGVRGEFGYGVGDEMFGFAAEWNDRAKAALTRTDSLAEPS